MPRITRVPPGENEMRAAGAVRVLQISPGEETQIFEYMVKIISPYSDRKHGKTVHVVLDLCQWKFEVQKFSFKNHA